MSDTQIRPAKGLGVFEKYLTLWVIVCIEVVRVRHREDAYRR